MIDLPVFRFGDYEAQCIVRRTGPDEVEVTLAAIRPADVAALMHAMKTVCGSRDCVIQTAASTSRMMCLRVEGRECRDSLTGGVEFVLSLRAFAGLDVAVCGETCGTLTCTEPMGHAGHHRDGRAPDCYPWSQTDCDRRPAPPMAAAPSPAKPAQRTPEERLCNCGAAASNIPDLMHAGVCRVVRHRREAPLVALVAAVPEGLDPIGWRAAVLAAAERHRADVLDMPDRFRREASTLCRSGDPVPTGTLSAVVLAVVAYRRQFESRAKAPPPERKRVSRGLPCDAYDD